MDPVSVTGLILQIAGVVSLAFSYVKQVKETQKDVRHLLGELLALKGVLEQISRQQDDAAVQQNHAATTSQSVRDALASTQGILNSIADELRGFQKPGRKVLKALAWLGTKSKLQSRIGQLESVKSYFLLVLMNDAS